MPYKMLAFPYTKEVKSRTVPGAEARLYEDLEWAGIQWDEG
jgi:hypothetical protein